MTKADRIRKLYATGKYTTRQIADIVGCGVPYVRTAARQRVDGHESKSDLAYRPIKRRQRAEIMDAGDRKQAARAKREAYGRARESGLSVVEANRIGQRFYNAIIYRTGRLASRNEQGGRA